MYIRRKTIKGHAYYYLVEGRRVGGRVQQKVIRYLGKSVAGFGSGGGSGGVPSPAPQLSPPPFTGFSDITTPVLEELNGRHTVNKQFIADLTRSRGIRQAERDIITAVLAELPEEVSVQEFADKMKAAILPLTGRTLKEGQYESISLPEDQRGPVAAYHERIYRSPIKTSAGSVHFNDFIDDYFAHTRIEDLPDGDRVLYDSNDLYNAKPIVGKTRRVIEIQSDLFQKGRLEREPGISTTYDITEQEAIEALNRGEKVYALEQSREGEVEIGREIKSPQDFSIAYDGYVAELQDRTHLAKLEPYRDTWYERIVGEEIKRAAQDGKTLLQFPTGETAMQIEGLGQEVGGGMMFAYKGFPVEPQDLKVGREIYSEANDQDWIITDVLGDGKFKAVPKRTLEMDNDSGLYNFAKDNRLLDSEGAIDEKKAFASKAFMEEYAARYSEQFDISGKVDPSNPIYRFYEHRIQRCLKRLKPDLQRVTDTRGVTWFQVELTPTDAEKPVPAFGVARSLRDGS